MSPRNQATFKRVLFANCCQFDDLFYLDIHHSTHSYSLVSLISLVLHDDRWHWKN